MESFVAVNKILRKPFCTTQHAQELKRLLNEFIDENDEGSTNFQNHSTEVDDLRPLLSCLEENAIPPELDSLCTKMLKILLRKNVNRISLNELGLRTVVIVLRRQLKLRGFALVDVCNVITNACFDANNAQVFVEEGGLDLTMSMLLGASKDNAQLLTALLSALQTMCYIPMGRRAVILNRQTLARISDCLSCVDSVSVRSRAAGVIHNLSVDVTSLAVLRDSISIPAMVQLLRDGNIETLQAATGALQNISRDFAAKRLILECGAVEFLADLLSCADVSCQVLNLFAMTPCIHNNPALSA
jgi:hypothetical protein